MAEAEPSQQFMTDQLLQRQGERHDRANYAQAGMMTEGMLALRHAHADLQMDELRRQQAGFDLQYAQALHSTDMIALQKRQLRAQTELMEAKSRTEIERLGGAMDPRYLDRETLLAIEAAGFELYGQPGGGKFGVRMMPEGDPRRARSREALERGTRGADYSTDPDYKRMLQMIEQYPQGRRSEFDIEDTIYQSDFTDILGRVPHDLSPLEGIKEIQKYVSGREAKRLAPPGGATEPTTAPQLPVLPKDDDPNTPVSRAEVPFWAIWPEGDVPENLQAQWYARVLPGIADGLRAAEAEHKRLGTKFSRKNTLAKMLRAYRERPDGMIQHARELGVTGQPPSFAGAR